MYWKGQKEKKKRKTILKVPEKHLHDRISHFTKRGGLGP
jgi:hypothetical protein